MMGYTSVDFPMILVPSTCEEQRGKENINNQNLNTAEKKLLNSLTVSKTAMLYKIQSCEIQYKVSEIIKRMSLLARTSEHGWSLVWPGRLVVLSLHCCFFRPMASTWDGACSQYPPITDGQLWPELLKQLTLSPEDSELSTEAQHIKTCN